MFDSLDAARSRAEALVSERALQMALAAGAIEPSVTVEYDDIHVRDDVDGELFLESTVIATAIGAACNWRAEGAA